MTPEYAVVKGEFLHVPKTGRLSLKGAPHQLQPRTADKDNPYFKVREMYVARPGHVLYEADFGGIEAVLTAYLSGVNNDGTAKVGCEDARQMLRLTGIDIHSFISSFDIGQPADWKWSDADLKAYLKLFRTENREWMTKGGRKLPFEGVRDCNKTGLYGSLYHGGPGTLVRSQPDVFPTVEVAAAVQKQIFELFPSVPKWWTSVCDEAEEFGYVTTPDGYRQHFSDVYDWRFSKRTKRWSPHMARIANECIAAKPQHLAMCFMAQGLAEFWENYPQHREGLRLTIHDSMLGEWLLTDMPDVRTAIRTSMEKPLSCLPLPAEWEMGTHLKVAIDGKMSKDGGNWREMFK